MKKERNIRAYIFNRGLIWIGWSLEIYEDEGSTLYYDDNPYLKLESNRTHITHLIFGLSENRVFGRLAKLIERDLKKEEKES